MLPRVRKVRNGIVAAAMGALRTQAHWHYAEIRPIPYAAFTALLNGTGTVVTTDCSGLATLTYFRAGAPDPNGLNYDGQGFTGDMMTHLHPIPLNRARRGDLVVFGAFPGKHVVILVEDPSTHPDPQCVSHGGEGDPKIAPLSHFAPLGVETVLRGVSARIIPRRRQRPRWLVLGDGGKVVGRVFRSRWLWMLRHRRVIKAQREDLHFKRIHPKP